jgi:hypothetical protein
VEQAAILERTGTALEALVDVAQQLGPELAQRIERMSNAGAALDDLEEAHALVPDLEHLQQAGVVISDGAVESIDDDGVAKLIEYLAQPRR